MKCEIHFRYRNSLEI